MSFAGGRLYEDMRSDKRKDVDLPLPANVTENELYSFLLSVRVEGADADELMEYCRRDYVRFGRPGAWSGNGGDNAWSLVRLHISPRCY